MIKSSLLRAAHKLGYNVTRRRPPDLALYGAYPKESLSARRFYNVGAGLFSHPYWTNIDYGSEHYAPWQREHPFIEHDLTKMGPLPIESNSAELVYSSHTIEHIGNAANRKLFEEIYRILKPGGAVRLTTDDAELEYEAYKRRDRSYWFWTQFPGADIEQLFLHHYATQLTEIDADKTPPKKYSSAEIAEVFSTRPLPDALEFFTSKAKFNPEFPGNHINWWTHDKAMDFLRCAGFKTVYRSAYMQSRFAPLREIPWFDTTYPMISLYVEAVK